MKFVQNWILTPRLLKISHGREITGCCKSVSCTNFDILKRNFYVLLLQARFTGDAIQLGVT